MRLPVEDRHEVFALCSYVFLDLNAEIAAVFRYTIEPIEQHPLIFGASDRIWIDLRMTKQVKRRLVEAKSLGAIPLVLVHQMRPKYSKEYLLAVKLLRLDVRLPLRRVRDGVVFLASTL